MAEVRFTIRISDMPRNDRAMAMLLREQGMVITDECTAVPPSTLTWQDHVNGAGARTFVWNDNSTADYYGVSSESRRAELRRFNFNNLPHLPQVPGNVVQNEKVEIHVQEPEQKRQLRLED